MSRGEMPAAAAGHRRSTLGILLLAAFGWFGFFAHGYLENTDAQITLQAARAWCLRGDPGLVRAGDEHLLADGQSSWPAERVIAERIAPTDPSVAPMFGVTGVNRKQYVQFPIGHQLLMVPFVMVGEWLAERFPEPERRRLAERGFLWGSFFFSQLLVSFLPALVGAGSVVVLLLLTRSLGACPRDALIATAAAVLCTQLWPGGSETMSDAPGTFFLLLSASAVARYASGTGTRRALLLAGAGGGAAVLVRYPHALPLLVLCAWAAWAAWRRRRLGDVRWLLAGGLPFAVLLLAANHLRFGHLLETGYSAGANKEWFSYPLYLGLPLLLLAPGKGILWFSPPLWIALSQYLRRGFWSAATAAALAVLVLPALVVGHTHGWAAGQCWGVRYLTPAVVLVVAVACAVGTPWRRRPRTFALLCGLGFVFSLGGVLTPYRGQQALAFEAASEVFRAELDAGLPPELLPDRVNFHPRFSPLHSHWTYAWLSLTGRLDSGRAEDTIEPLFGVSRMGPVPVPAPEDRGFRHWWMPFLADWLGLPAWPLWALGWWATTGWLTWLGVRRFLRQDQVGGARGR